MTRRLFLKRAGQASGVFVFLPTVSAIAGADRHRHHRHKVTKRHHDPSGYFEHTIVAMGTTARVGIYAESEKESDRIITMAFDELKRLESLFTIFNASSEIAKLNASAGGALLPCSVDTFTILSAAKKYSDITDGAFDATVEPLMELWGFRSELKELRSLPTQDQIDSTLQFVGSNQIELADAGASVRLKTAGAKLDLGSIAMGYAIDRMVEILKSERIEHGFINISGDMYALGSPKGLRHGEQGWAVAIPDPRETSKIIHWTNITDQALSSAGNYESFVLYQARKFGHIMDPHEGRSASGRLSATVIAPHAIDTDALSTASFVTGRRYGDTKLIVVDGYGKVSEL